MESINPLKALISQVIPTLTIQLNRHQGLCLKDTHTPPLQLHLSPETVQLLQNSKTLKSLQSSFKVSSLQHLLRDDIFFFFCIFCFYLSFFLPAVTELYYITPPLSILHVEAVIFAISNYSNQDLDMIKTGNFKCFRMHSHSDFPTRKYNENFLSCIM